MQKIICKKVYDTAVATVVKKVAVGCYGDPAGYEETLYQMPDGAYFLYTNGGAESKYTTESIVRKSKAAAHTAASSAEFQSPLPLKAGVEAVKARGKAGRLLRLLGDFQERLRLRDLLFQIRQMAEGGEHEFIHRLSRGGGGDCLILSEKPHRAIPRQKNRACGGLVFPRDQAKKRGLARAVDADDAEAVPFVDGKADVFQHRFGAEGQGQSRCG